MENITLGGKTREVTDEQLEAIEKILAPELQELEEDVYGLDGCSFMSFSHVRILLGGKSYKRGGSFHTITDDCRKNFIKYGNIFDDLDQYAKDAEDIQTECPHMTSSANRIRVTINEGYPCIETYGGYVCPDCAIKHAHAIIQVALTAKRKAK